MKMYGFSSNFNGANLLEEVNLEVDSATLRDLAKFFIICADEMDNDNEWDHEHFCDYLERELEHDVVVSSARTDLCGGAPGDRKTETAQYNKWGVRPSKVDNSSG